MLRELWDRAHAILQTSPRNRATQNRQHAPALLKGLIYGLDGRAMSPTHGRSGGRLYRYYLAQHVLEGRNRTTALFAGYPPLPSKPP